MAKYIALLRAINVGGHTVKMDRLRALFEELGFGDVETFIASGNVIFESRRKDTRKLEEDIQKHLRESLGYDVATFVRTPAELASVAAHRAAASAAPDQTVYVGFMAEKPLAANIAALGALASEANEFDVAGREVYWRIRGNFSDSKITNAVLEKKLGRAATFRNLTTVTKLALKYE